MSAPLPAGHGLTGNTRRTAAVTTVNTVRTGRRLGLAAVLAWVAWPALALAAPKGRVLLSISGQISAAGSQTEFDLAMLDALPQHSFSTSTPWFKTPRKFSGPLLRDVLAAVGAKGSLLHAVALNNYKVEIPAEDAARYTVLLATRMDDQTMPVRDKGPLFIVYPYDDSADLRSERFYSRSAWQLRKIEVK